MAEFVGSYLSEPSFHTLWLTTFSSEKSAAIIHFSKMFHHGHKAQSLTTTLIVAAESPHPGSFVQVHVVTYPSSWHSYKLNKLNFLNTPTHTKCMNLVEISHLHLKECVTACSVQYEMVDKGMFTGLKRIWGNQEYWKPWAWRSTLNEPDGRYWSSLCTEPVDRSTLKGLLGTRTEGARLFWGIGDSFASHMELLKFIWPGCIGTSWWLPPQSSQCDDRPVTHQLLTTETILYGQNPQQNRNESDAGSFYHFGQECCNVSRSVADVWGRKGMTVEKCGAWISVRGQTDIKLPRVTLQMWAPVQMLMIPPELRFILLEKHISGTIREHLM